MDLKELLNQQLKGTTWKSKADPPYRTFVVAEVELARGSARDIFEVKGTFYNPQANISEQGMLRMTDMYDCYELIEPTSTTPTR